MSAALRLLTTRPAMDNPYAPILQRLRDAGQWIAADRDTVRKLVDHWITSGAGVTEHIAVIDLCYWMDRGELPGYRALAERWGWKPDEARRLMEQLGILKKRDYSNRSPRTTHARPTQSDAESTHDPANPGENRGESTQSDAESTHDPRTTHAEHSIDRACDRLKTPDGDGEDKSRGVATLPPSASDEAQREAEAQAELERRREEYRARRKAFRAARLEAQAAEVYRKYPRKAKRPPAIRAIKRAIQSAGYEFVLDQTILYAELRAREIKAGDDKRFTPHPATWYNAEQYNDDPKTWERIDGTATQSTPPTIRRGAPQRERPTPGYQGLAADIQRELERKRQQRGERGSGPV